MLLLLNNYGVVKTSKLDCLLTKFELQGICVYHHHIHTFGFTSVKNKIYIHLSLWLTLQTRRYICTTPDYERNFCSVVEMKFRSLFSGMQQGGASETAAESVTPCFCSPLEKV